MTEVWRLWLRLYSFTVAQIWHEETMLLYHRMPLRQRSYSSCKIALSCASICSSYKLRFSHRWHCVKILTQGQERTGLVCCLFFYLSMLSIGHHSEFEGPCLTILMQVSKIWCHQPACVKIPLCSEVPTCWSFLVLQMALTESWWLSSC